MTEIVVSKRLDILNHTMYNIARDDLIPITVLSIPPRVSVTPYKYNLIAKYTGVTF